MVLLSILILNVTDFNSFILCVDHFESTGSFSEGSSIGGQSTATISNYEFPSLTMSTDITTDLHILDLDGSSKNLKFRY